MFSETKTMKMVWMFSLFIMYLEGLTGAGQESFEILNLYDSSSDGLPTLSQTGPPLAVSVNHLDLNEVSSSVLMAESWLRRYVLGHYPATKITTIVVGHNVLCNQDQEPNFGLVLPSLKNLYHSLTRWGLEKEIKLSAAFSSSCLHPYYFAMYRDDIAERVIKPILSFIQATNSTYSVNPAPMFSPLSDEVLSLISSHSDSMKKLGFLRPHELNVLHTTSERKPTSVRKLSFVSSKFVDPYPARPTPLPEISPIHSSIGYSVPATVAKLPPPLPSYSPPQPEYHSPPPQIPPFTDPANPPYGFTLPPCSPVSHGGSSTAPVPPKSGEINVLWCVAKPSVPVETLQEAMDYACGQGGADCDEIKPHGSCYYPDTLVAHASYAFNSYWQKNKKMGGTCNFGGTAMIINADPSFLHCRFVLS